MRTGLALIVALILGATPASAQDAQPDPGRGHALALRWCVTCHVVAPDAPGGDAGPTFVSVATRPGQTEQGVRNWLAAPHPPMPDLNLAKAEFDDLAAYILSLRD